MSLKNPPWKANKPARKAVKPSKNTSAELDEVDVPIASDGPCDGMTAGDLFRLYGNEAVDSICERVQKSGGRPQ